MTSTPSLVVAPEPALALARAWSWTLDLAFGELRSALHPVAWLGSVLARVGRVLRDAPAALAFVGWASVWPSDAVTLAAATWWLEAKLLAPALKPSFAWGYRGRWGWPASGARGPTTCCRGCRRGARRCC